MTAEGPVSPTGLGMGSTAAACELGASYHSPGWRSSIGPAKAGVAENTIAARSETGRRMTPTTEQERCRCRFRRAEAQRRRQVTDLAQLRNQPRAVLGAGPIR